MKPLIRAVRTRWRFAGAMLAVLVLAVGAGAVLLPWTYQSEAGVVFLSSRVVSKSAGGNPYLVFASSLTVSAEVVGRRMMDDQAVQSMRRQGHTAAYTVGVAPDSAGPVLSITVTGTDPTVTQETMKALVTAVGAQLDSLQANLKPDARITTAIVSSTDSPHRVRKPKIQLLGELTLGGLALAAAILLLVQAIADRRKPATPDAEPDEDIDYRALWMDTDAR